MGNTSKKDIKRPQIDSDDERKSQDDQKMMDIYEQNFKMIKTDKLREELVECHSCGYKFPQKSVYKNDYCKKYTTMINKEFNNEATVEYFAHAFENRSQLLERSGLKTLEECCEFCVKLSDSNYRCILYRYRGGYNGAIYTYKNELIDALFYTCRYCVSSDQAGLDSNINKDISMTVCEGCNLSFPKMYFHDSYDQFGNNITVCYDCTLTCAKCNRKDCEWHGNKCSSARKNAIDSKNTDNIHDKNQFKHLPDFMKNFYLDYVSDKNDEIKPFVCLSCNVDVELYPAKK